MEQKIFNDAELNMVSFSRCTFVKVDFSKTDPTSIKFYDCTFANNTLPDTPEGFEWKPSQFDSKTIENNPFLKEKFSERKREDIASKKPPTSIKISVKKPLTTFSKTPLSEFEGTIENPRTAIKVRNYGRYKSAMDRVMPQTSSTTLH